MGVVNISYQNDIDIVKISYRIGSKIFNIAQLYYAKLTCPLSWLQFQKQWLAKEQDKKRKKQEHKVALRPEESVSTIHRLLLQHAL